MGVFSSIRSQIMVLNQNKFFTVISYYGQKGFQELKDRLTFNLVFTLSEGSNGFVVYYDASTIGLGSFLMQNGKVIFYASRQLNIHKKKLSYR
ncbi:hypothetical protein MTR67_051783 [Solanum verrucosum]|uniref:Reverse transcriptase/retrotransposon-derived protein RNase H-like domain-containing protein n=1 Tax=Solanum verrucosum TaxID=315347 RepID=A0AAF1A2F3_SOLVR|nr:hypothetical protein MTR67_051783 [Solanum verrucosum]